MNPRLAYVLNYFPYGHASIVNELRILHEASVDVHIVAKRRRRSNDFLRVQRSVNYPVTYVADGDRQPAWRRVIRDNLAYSFRHPSSYALVAANSLRWQGSNFKLACSFARVLESIAPTLVYVNWSWATCGSVMYACQMLKLPFIFSVRGTDITPPAPNFALRTSTAKRILTPSEGYADILVEKHNVPRDKLRVVPDCLDFTDFLQLRPARGKLEGPLRLLSVGTLRPVKRYEDLIRCCHLLRQKNLLFQCCIFGDGPSRSKLQALIKKLNLDDRIFLRGNIPRKELLAQYEWSDICVHTSQRESFCYAVVEAQASGRPVVVADAVGGIRRSVRPGVTAILVPIGQPQAAAKAISHLADDTQRRLGMGKAGREYVSKTFSIEQVGPELLEALLS